ncbi:MAG: hypothetical protein RL689_707 [Planctomycetota bacterium]|jgi:hypothetical protein
METLLVVGRPAASSISLLCAAVSTLTFVKGSDDDLGGWVELDPVQGEYTAVIRALGRSAHLKRAYKRGRLCLGEAESRPLRTTALVSAISVDPGGDSEKVAVELVIRRSLPAVLHAACDLNIDLTTLISAGSVGTASATSTFHQASQLWGRMRGFRADCELIVTPTAWVTTSRRPTTALVVRSGLPNTPGAWLDLESRVALLATDADITLVSAVADDAGWTVTFHASGDLPSQEIDRLRGDGYGVRTFPL